MAEPINHLTLNVMGNIPLLLVEKPVCVCVSLCLIQGQCVPEIRTKTPAGNTIMKLYQKGDDQISNKTIEMGEMLGVSSHHHGKMEVGAKRQKEKMLCYVM